MNLLNFGADLDKYADVGILILVDCWALGEVYHYC